MASFTRLDYKTYRKHPSLNTGMKGFRGNGFLLFSLITILHLICLSKYSVALCCQKNRSGTFSIVGLSSSPPAVFTQFKSYKIIQHDARISRNIVTLKAKKKEEQEEEQPTKKNPVFRFFSRFGKKKQEESTKEPDSKDEKRISLPSDDVKLSAKNARVSSEGVDNPDTSVKKVESRKGILDSLGGSVSGGRDKVKEIEDEADSNQKGVFGFFGRNTTEVKNSNEVDVGAAMQEKDEGDSSGKNGVLEVLESLTSARGKMSEVRLSTQNKVSDDKALVWTNAEEEKNILFDLRQDLERSKKQQKKDKEEQVRQQKALAAEKEKQKKLAKKEADKRKKEQKLSEQREKERLEKLKAVVKASQTTAGQKSATEKSKSNFDIKALVAGGLGNTQSFISNAWDSVFGDEEEWKVVFPKTRISPGEIVPITIGGIDLLIVASKDAKKLHCIVNSCPHLGTPLETGIIEERPKENFPYGTDLANNDNVKSTQTGNNVTAAGCEDCIVCPLHRTAFALESGEVRGEWCPYPPVIGKMMGTIKPKNKLTTFAIRARGKNIEVRINSAIKK